MIAVDLPLFGLGIMLVACSVCLGMANTLSTGNRWPGYVAATAIFVVGVVAVWSSIQ